MNQNLKMGLFGLGNFIVICLVILLYHFFINKPLVNKMAGAGKTIYTVNSKMLLGEYEEKIKEAVLSGEIERAETIKGEYIAYLGKLQDAAKKVAKEKDITIYVSDAIVESKNTVDISKLLESIAKKQ